MSMDFLMPGTVNTSEFPGEPRMLAFSLCPRRSPAAFKEEPGNGN